MTEKTQSQIVPDGDIAYDGSPQYDNDADEQWTKAPNSVAAPYQIYGSERNNYAHYKKHCIAHGLHLKTFDEWLY